LSSEMATCLVTWSQPTNNTNSEATPSHLKVDIARPDREGKFIAWSRLSALAYRVGRRSGRPAGSCAAQSLARSSEEARPTSAAEGMESSAAAASTSRLAL